MTTKHLAQGLMQATKATSHANCEAKLGLAVGQMHHWYNDHHRDIKASMLGLLHDKSGLSFDTMMGWYRLPEDAVLGPISR